ncbi:MAG: TonB-dependent receptor [Hyphomicrobium sp.]|jgi:iron complex outermembrane receptor protein
MLRYKVSALAIIAVMGITKTAGAQQASATQAGIELPAVVVTTPSPVAKSKAKDAAPRPSAASAAPVEGPLPPASVSSELPGQVLPGLLIVAEDAFAPVTVVTAREALATQGPTITDTLQMKPGITGSTFAPGASRPIIRGLDSYRVRVQENGIGSHDVSSISEDHAVPIDPISADRIEVVRGPATLRYGSGAIGGVVATENQRIPTFIPPGGFSSEIKGGLSSVDDGTDGGFQTTAGSHGVAVHLDGFKRSSGDYETPRGQERNSFVESDGLGAGLSRVWSDGYVGISVSQFSSVYGVPGDEAEEGVDPRIDLAQDNAQARGEWRPRAMGVDAIRFWFGASDYAHNELAKLTGDEFEIGSRFTNREQEARIEIQHLPIFSPLGEFTGAIGVQFDHRQTRGQSFEGDSLLEPARTRSSAAFWFEELKANDRLTYQAAFRLEHSSIDGFGWTDVSNPNAPVEFDGEKDFIPVSGSLGLLYKLGFDTTGRLTGQLVERAPDAAELYSKGAHEATGTFEIGNPNLEKERAFSVEAGLARAEGPFRFDAAAFYSRYQGFIYRALQDVRCLGFLVSCGTPAADGAPENFDLVSFQQRDATFFGVELAAQYDVAHIWRGVWGIDGRYDFVNAQFEGGENVPRIPPHRLGGGVYYRDNSWFAHAAVLHGFDQTRIGVNEIATPGYTLVSAEVGYTAEVSPGTSMTIGLKGENLGNDEVLNHASFKRREEVLGPGASVRLFGSIKLN